MFALNKQRKGHKQDCLYINLSLNSFFSFESHHNDGIVYTGEVTSRNLATSVTVATHQW